MNNPEEYHLTKKGYESHNICGRLHAQNLPCMRRLALHLVDNSSEITHNEKRFLKIHNINIRDEFINYIESYLYKLDWTYDYITSTDD